MQSMIPHNAFFGRHLEMFDPCSLYFWDDFPHRAPMMAHPRPFMPQMMFPQMNFPQMPAPVARTKIEHKETPEAHHFLAELPGLRKEDVDVHVEDGKLLHISAKKKHNREENSENYYYVESGGGEFVTRFMLPPNVRVNQMSTCVDNGKLIVTVPKENIDMSNQRQHHMSNQRHHY